MDTLVFKLYSKTMEDYLLKNKSYIDELVDFGAFVHHEEPVDAIFEGLPSNYAPDVLIFESKKHTPIIAKIEALLHCYET